MFWLCKCFAVCQAGGEGGVGDGSDNSGGEVELCTVDITVETEAMSVKYLYRMKRRGWSTGPWGTPWGRCEWLTVANGDDLCLSEGMIWTRRGQCQWFQGWIWGVRWVWNGYSFKSTACYLDILLFRQNANVVIYFVYWLQLMLTVLIPISHF